MGELHITSEAFGAARRLIGIAEMETGRPLKGSRVLISGEGALADALHELLNGRGAKAALLGKDMKETAAADSFDAAFLLEHTGDGQLSPFMREGSVVIDASVYKSGDTVLYDCSLPYRRVRVIALSKQG